jgi:hypothetical protein
MPRARRLRHIDGLSRLGRRICDETNQSKADGALSRRARRSRAQCQHSKPRSPGALGHRTIPAQAVGIRTSGDIGTEVPVYGRAGHVPKKE